MGQREEGVLAEDGASNGRNENEKKGEKGSIISFFFSFEPGSIQGNEFFIESASQNGFNLHIYCIGAAWNCTLQTL